LSRQKDWNFRHIEVQIAKSHVRFDRDDVFVRRHVVCATGEGRLRSQRELHPVRDLFLGAPEDERPLDVDRIKNAVNVALAAKGWTQVNSGGDVSIPASEIIRDQQTLSTFYDGFWGCGVGDDLLAVV
jgi:hypothetical protein